MDRFKALGRGSQLMLVGSVLLLIVSFFRWQEVSVDLGPLGSASGGVTAWDDIGGILMGILTIVLIARLVAQLAAVDIPIPVSFAMTSAVLAFLILIIAVLKNLTDDYSTFWSYLGIAFAALIAVGAWMEIQAAGGMDHVRGEMSSAGIGGGGAAATEAAAPPATEAPVAETTAEATTEAAEAEEAEEPPAAEAAAETPEDAAGESPETREG
jgi:hypothetical protein